MWVDIEGYEGIYFINSLGQVKRNNKLLKEQNTTNGYMQYCLCINGQAKYYRTHRLLASAFLDKIDGKNVVNHKDGNKTNNNLDNLEWCTASENHKHSYNVLGRKAPYSMLGRFGKDHNRSKSFKVRMLCGEVREFFSGLEFARETGLSHSSISYARKEKNIPYVFKHGKIKGIELLEC